MSRRRIAAIAAAAGLSAAIGLALWQAVSRLDEPYRGFEAPVTLDYKPGMSGWELAEELARLGVVRSKWDFLAARAWRGARRLLAGEYRFEKPASVWEVLEKIAQGKVILYPITVPEGLTRFETARLLADAGYGSYDDILALTADAGLICDLFPAARTLEGCLYPDTYAFPRYAGAEEVVARMVATFREVFEPLLRNKTTPLDGYEALIVASMVEKETALDEERGLVSSVYHNRIRRGMLMQCDPTIIYGLMVEGRYRGAIYRSDLDDPHEYNTYVHAGLPPGPIANPGRASLEAALNPPESEYLFFVAESAGEQGHVFSTTASDHNRAVAEYRRTQGR